MGMINLVLERKLAAADIAISNALADEGIREALSRFAYKPERLKQGLGLYKTAGKLHQEQLDSKAVQYKAMEKLQEILGQAKKKYILFRSVSRLALRDHAPLRNILALEGRSKRGLGAWMEEARLFYTNTLAHDDILEKLAGFAVTKEDLQEGKKLVDEVEKAGAFHQLQKGKVQQATKKRDQAFKALDAWMRDFWEICRLALADTPQKIAKLKMKKSK